jgi:hypothetical protein
MGEVAASQLGRPMMDYFYERRLGPSLLYSLVSRLCVPWNYCSVGRNAGVWLDGSVSVMLANS